MVCACVRACVRVHVAAERVLGEGGSIVAKMIVVDADDDVDATALLGVGGGAADGAGTTGRGKEPPLGRFRVLRPTVRPHALPAGSRLRTAPAPIQSMHLMRSVPRYCRRTARGLNCRRVSLGCSPKAG